MLGDTPMTRTKSTYLTILAVLLSPMGANADIISVDVLALDHSYNSSEGTGLDTGVDIEIGDVLAMVATGCWSAGNNNRTSDADGLVGPNPCSGDAWNFGLYTRDGLSAPYGSLVGKIGSGSFFIVGTAFSETTTTAGRLYLYYWDTFTPDNSGSVNVQIHTSVPEPGTLALLGLGLLGMGAARRRKKA